MVDMQSFVALLRGVNVGGGNKVPMAELRALCAGLGWADVQSYIASGNLVFRAPPGDHAGDLRRAMAGQMGVDVPVMVLPGAEVRAALADCPFDPEEGRMVHCYFLWQEPEVDRDLFKDLKSDGDGLEVKGKTAWLHTPGGFGKSKLAEKMAKVLKGTDMTARNLNTVRKLTQMLDG